MSIRFDASVEVDGDKLFTYIRLTEQELTTMIVDLITRVSNLRIEDDRGGTGYFIVRWEV